jgi:hypothetical protein
MYLDEYIAWGCSNCSCDIWHCTSSLFNDHPQEGLAFVIVSYSCATYGIVQHCYFLITSRKDLYWKEKGITPLCWSVVYNYVLWHTLNAPCHIYLFLEVLIPPCASGLCSRRHRVVCTCLCFCDHWLVNVPDLCTYICDNMSEIYRKCNW